MPTKIQWYCPHCKYGPHDISIHKFCILCNRRANCTAQLERIRITRCPAPTATIAPLATKHLADIIPSTNTQEEAMSEQSSLCATGSTRDSDDHFSITHVLPDTEEEPHITVSTEALRELANDSAVPFCRIPRFGRLDIGDEDLSSATGASPEVKPLDLHPLDYNNLLKGEFVSKNTQIEDFLFNPDNPWNPHLIAYPMRRTLPGVSSYSLETGEPATTPRRQPYSPKRRVEVEQTRRLGACSKCRKGKKALKCYHKLDGSSSQGAYLDGSASSVATRGSSRDGVRHASHAAKSDKSMPIDPGPLATSSSATSTGQWGIVNSRQISRDTTVAAAMTNAIPSPSHRAVPTRTDAMRRNRSRRIAYRRITSMDLQGCTIEQEDHGSGQASPEAPFDDVPTLSFNNNVPMQGHFQAETSSYMAEIEFSSVSDFRLVDSLRSPRGAVRNLQHPLAIESSLFPSSDALEVIMHNESQMAYQYSGFIDIGDDLGMENEMRTRYPKSSALGLEPYNNSSVSDPVIFGRPRVSYDAPFNHLTEPQSSYSPQGPVGKRTPVHTHSMLQEPMMPIQINSDEALSPRPRHSYVADAFPELPWLDESCPLENVGRESLRDVHGDFQPNSATEHNQAEDMSWSKEAEKSYDQYIDFDPISPIEVFPGRTDITCVESIDSSTGASLTTPSVDSANSNQAP